MTNHMLVTGLVVCGMALAGTEGAASTPGEDGTEWISSVFFDSDILPDLETQRLSSGHLLVRGVIGDRAGWFILDTGAGANAVSRDVAERRGAPLPSDVEVEGVGGKAAGNVWRVPDVRVGPLHLGPGAEFIALDLGFLREAWGLEVLGILGYPALSRAVVEIDISQPRVSVHDPSLYSRQGLTWRPANLVGGQLLVPATFEGHSGMFRLDTGSSWNGILHTPVVDSLALLRGRKTTEGATGGVEGQATFRTGNLRTFAIWGKTYKDLPFNFSTAAAGAFASSGVAGNLGSGILSRFELVLDYSHNRYAVVEKQ